MYAIIAGALVVIWTFCKIADYLKSINNHLKGHEEKMKSIHNEIFKIRRKIPGGDPLDDWLFEPKE